MAYGDLYKIIIISLKNTFLTVIMMFYKKIIIMILFLLILPLLAPSFPCPCKVTYAINAGYLCTTTLLLVQMQSEFLPITALETLGINIGVTARYCAWGTSSIILQKVRAVRAERLETDNRHENLRTQSNVQPQRLQPENIGRR